MQENRSIQYLVTASGDNTDTFIVLNFSDTSGATDAEILALVESLRAVPWPTALGTIRVAATRDDITDVSTRCLASTVPATFN